MAKGYDEKSKRRILLLMIFAPGIFFIIYWIAIQSGNKHSTLDTIKPPETYYNLGQTIQEKNINYDLRIGEKVFSDQINLKNNIAVAEPNTIFIGLGLNTTSKIIPEVRLLDQEGNAYRPLNVNTSVIINSFGFNDEAQQLYLFKVRSGAGFYYFQISKDPKITWRIKEEKER